MRESNGVIFSYLSPTWTRSPSCSRSPTWIGITPRCDLSSPGHSRHPTHVGVLVEVGILVGLGVLLALGVLK